MATVTALKSFTYGGQGYVAGQTLEIDLSTDGGRRLMNLGYVDPGGDNGNFGAWNALTLLNAFTGTAKYRLTTDRKSIQFHIVVNNGASGAVACTLPTGARPASLVVAIGGNSATSGFCYWTIAADGSIVPTGPTALQERTLMASLPFDG